jgi:hypothetical protein
MADKPDRIRIKKSVNRRCFVLKTLLIYKKSGPSPRKREKKKISGIFSEKVAREGEKWSSYIWKIIPH